MIEMEKNRKRHLEKHGWRIGDAKDLLSLTAEEMAYIETKIALSSKVREMRKARGLTQEETADLLGSSQSRVAKIEAGDPSVSIDLQVKTLIALGASKKELAEAIEAGAAAAH
jgi:DNA-binding XRE family transcriptional regulator